MSIILRSSLLVLIALAFATTASADDDAPLQLDSEHLGMTSEGIADAERQAETERFVDDAIEKSEWTDEDLAGDDAFCECPVCDDVVPAPVAAPIETRAVGVTSYDSCIEVAIRSGNGFKAASSVCQALFPEPVEADAAAEVEADDEVGAAPSAADDGAPELSAAVTAD